MIILLVAPGGFAGCSWVQAPPTGEILVSRPEVFTRQRLVNRRLTEQTWLEDQLKNTPTETRFQGYGDVREFIGLYNKTSAAFDPLTSQTVVAQTKLIVQQLPSFRGLYERRQRAEELGREVRERQVPKVAAAMRRS